MNRRGFTLIELAVAVLVLGVGILAVFALGQAGERAAGEVEDETRAALFADDVFDTLRLYADHVSRSTNRADWVAFWDQLARGAALPGSGTVEPPFWAPGDGAADAPVIRGDRVIHRVRWLPRGTPAAAENPGEYALQYRLSLTNASAEAVWATLHVWGGAQRRQDEPFVFYTHFADRGGLP